MIPFKHLLILTPGFPENEADSACVPVVQAYLRGLQQACPHWKISIITLQFPYSTRPYLWHGLSVYPLGGQNQRWQRPFHFYQAWRCFQAIHAQTPVDYLHAMWLTEAALLGQWLSRQARLPLVTTVMGQDALKENHYLRWLNLSQIHLATLSTAANPYLAQYARPRLIPIGLPPEETGGQPWSERRLDLLAVGNLIPLKQQAQFVDVVHALRQTFPTLQAAIIGDGPEKNALLQQIHQLQLGANLQLWGALPRPQVLQWMRRSRVLVLSSRYEGMGYVVLEALGQGAHVVSTPVGISIDIEPYTPKCALAADLNHFTKATEGFLTHPIDDQPHLPFPLAASIEAYLELYLQTGR